jgi:peptide/nickel transport system substrate-binding protein
MYLWPVYDRLTQLNGDTAQPEPMLATAWKVSDDGKSVTFTLRDGVKFQDGTPFDADAVKKKHRADADRERLDGEGPTGRRGVRRRRRPQDGQGEHEGRAGRSDARDLRRVRRHDGQPKAFENTNLKQIGVGSGPYKVVSNDAGTVTYEPFDGYWDKSVQKVAKIIATPIPDDQTRLNAVISGSQNGVLLRGPQLDTARKSGVTVITNVSPTPTGFEINMNRAKFGDPRVRQAIQYALDRKAISDAAFGGTCEPNSQIFAKGYFAYNDSIGVGYTQDLDKAKALMAEAGLSGGFEFELSSPNIPTYVTMVTAVQAQLAKINIKVKLNIVAGAAANAAYWVEHRTDALVAPTRS